MATRSRSDLKSYFVKNAIPTEGNFADLIDSQLNQSQDGVFKPDGEALSVVAAPGAQKRALRLYSSYPATSPDWMISLNPALDPADATTARPGFGVTDSAGKTRLFIDAATGQIGVGTNAPEVALDVAGAAQANGFRGRYDAVLNDYRTVNPMSNVCLQAPGNDRDAWIYRDPNDTSNNWGIYHRQIDSAVGNLPGNSIGFVGGSGSQLQAYVNLTDGSGFFAGPLRVPGGIAFDGTAAHIDRDGALYRTNEDVYLTIDGNFYIREPGSSTWLARFDTPFPDPQRTTERPKGRLSLKGNLGSHGYDPDRDHPAGWAGGVTTWDLIAFGSGYAHGGFNSRSFDLAERFAYHEDGLEPGDVLAVDPRSPERLIRSRSAQQDDLVGVVSERPGFILGVAWEAPDSGVPLALAGRVPVKVNLEGGPIRIGDYLTSSSQPGVAMRTIQSGRVLGVAMQAFDGTSGGEGKVVVLVNPHWFGGR